MKKGMTPENVEKMAGDIDGAADSIGQIFETVKGRVQGLDWTGDDRDRYVADFESVVGDAVRQVQQQATDLAERARRNASEQRNASA